MVNSSSYQQVPDIRLLSAEKPCKKGSDVPRIQMLMSHGVSPAPYKERLQQDKETQRDVTVLLAHDVESLAI